MATSQLWKLSALSTPAGLIPSLMSREIDLGIMEYVLRGDGKVSPQFYANMHQRPAFKASTVAVAAALAALGSGFYPFTAATTLYLAKLASGAGVATGAVHASLSGSKGCIIPRRISVEHKKEAEFDFEGYFISTDGIAAPLAYTGSVSLPAMTVAGEAFTLGLGAVNGSILGGLKKLTIEWNYDEIIEGSSGELYDTFACFDEFSPKLSFVTEDAALINTITPAGVAATAGRFFLQKLAPAGRVAAGTAAHVKFSITSGFYQPKSIKENDKGQTEMEVEVVGLDDGTNAILAISTAAIMS